MSTVHKATASNHHLGMQLIVISCLVVMPGRWAQSQIGPSPDSQSEVISVLNNECGLGSAGQALIDGALSRLSPELEQSQRREISALLEEARRKLWNLANEVKTEQWHLGEIALNPTTPLDAIKKQYTKIQILCYFLVETALEARERLMIRLKERPAGEQPRLRTDSPKRAASI